MAMVIPVRTPWIQFPRVRPYATAIIRQSDSPNVARMRANRLTSDCNLVC
jgi:hypothetical protein